MSKTKPNRINFILPVAAVIILISLIGLLISQIIARRSADEIITREQLQSTVAAALAVAGDDSPCRPLQAIYSTVDDEIFDQYYSACNTALANLAAASRPAIASADQLYAAIDRVLPLSSAELSFYQTFRSQHTPTLPTPSIFTDTADTEPAAESESSESTDDSATLLYEALNTLRDAALALSDGTSD